MRFCRHTGCFAHDICSCTGYTLKGCRKPKGASADGHSRWPYPAGTTRRAPSSAPCSTATVHVTTAAFLHCRGQGHVLRGDWREGAGTAGAGPAGAHRRHRCGRRQSSHHLCSGAIRRSAISGWDACVSLESSAGAWPSSYGRCRWPEQARCFSAHSADISGL